MLVADLFGVNRTAALKKIDCPTLIIASAKSDELARQQAGASQIWHARFEKIEDAAHAVFLDQPERFDELLEKFVKDLTTGSAGFNAVDCEPGKHRLHLKRVRRVLEHVLRCAGQTDRCLADHVTPAMQSTNIRLTKPK